MLVYIKLLLTSVFWAGTFIAGRIIGRNTNIDPVTVAFLRFLVSVFFMIFFVGRFGKSLPRLSLIQLTDIVILGLTGVFVYHILFLKGLQIVSASRASVIIATSPIFIALSSSYLFKEKLTAFKLAGILLSIAGAVLVICRGNLAAIATDNIGLGEICIFGCVLCWTVYSLVTKKTAGSLSAAAIVFYSVLVGTLFLFLTALLQGFYGQLKYCRMVDWLCILYLAVFGTVLSYIWYYEGIERIGPTRTALFINFIPVFTVVLGFLFLKEQLDSSLLTGTVLVVSGVYLTNKKSKGTK